MFHLKLAETEQQVVDHFNDLEISGVGLATQTDGVLYYKYEKDWSKEYMTFKALEDCTFTFSGATTGHTLKYSTDNGSNWWTLASTATTPTVTSGNSIMWKQTGLTPVNYTGIGTFSSTGRFEAQGNVMSLYYGDNFSGQTSLSGKNCAFYNLFSGCTGLTTAENLLLPATTLTGYCYGYMFEGCTALTTAPELPATILADNCYDSMFNGCTSLTTAPELPATTLARFCYSNMFSNCTSLTTAPALPVTTLSYACYRAMFRYCTSLTTAPELPATTLNDGCYEFMFEGCTSLTTSPSILPATTLAGGCYYDMFCDCTSLRTAPELPAPILTDWCYSEMFSGCSSLNYIKCLATNISSGTSCTENWVVGVSSSGTFVKSPSMTSWTTGTNGIPSTGWTVQNA